MGLLTGYQDDADRLARQDKNLARTYNHDLRGIKAEATPHEQVVKDYNTQVDGFKNSAVHRADKPDEVWQIIAGWISPNGQYALAPVRGDSAGYPYYGPGGIPDYSYYSGAGTGLYAGQDPYINGQTGGWNMWFTDQAGKTIRSAVDGSPVIGRANYGQANMYASWNDRPFVAPVTQSQIDTSKSADAKLTELGTQGEEIKAEADAARGLLTKKSDRIADDIEMNAGRLREDVAPTPQSGSVFDQNMAGIHQTIADWLHQ